MGLLTELRGDVETPYLEYMWCNRVYWSYESEVHMVTYGQKSSSTDLFYTPSS